MKYFSIIFNSLYITKSRINDEIVNSLYTLSKISMFALFILSSLTVFTFGSVLGIYIYLWYSLMLLLIIIRINDINIFINYRNKYTIEKWYYRFFYLTLLTAFIFSSLGFIFIFYVDDAYKFYIIFAIIGISTGSSTSLSSDFNLNILYSTILFLPLILAVLWIDTFPLQYIIFVSLILLYIIKLITIRKSFAQKISILKLESENYILHNLFENSPFGVFIYDSNLKILNCNDKLSLVLENPKEKIIGLNLSNLPDKRPLYIFQNPFTNKNYTGSYVSLKGKEFWMEARSLTFDKKMDKNFRGIGIIEDKTKEHNAIVQLEFMAKHDVLTGLLNRRGYTSAINNIIEGAEHLSHYSILFYLDLNQFKAINDSLGHEIGDQVLVIVAERLQEINEESSVICRLGGDEFVYLLSYVSESKDEAEKISKRIAHEIQQIFHEPCIINDMQLKVSSSIGVIYVKPRDTNKEEILRHADLTMYQAKRNNLSISYYDSKLDEEQKKLFLLQQELGYAQDKNELKLYLQPIANMKTNTLYAAELLIRWEHPNKGILSPDKFLPLAIKAGLLSDITWWLIKSVCEKISQWKKDGIWRLKYISVNINPHQLLEYNFVDNFVKTLSEYDVAHHEIILEITERSLIDNFENTQDVISELKINGISCAIDDFGIGYSSLSYLKRLSLDTLKIDREFVKDIGKDPNELVLMQTILNIGRQFNYHIIIEGIEEQEHLEELLKMDDNLYYQGYLYSKALEINKFAEKILK